MINFVGLDLEASDRLYYQQEQRHQPSTSTSGSSIPFNSDLDHVATTMLLEKPAEVNSTVLAVKDNTDHVCIEHTELNNMVSRVVLRKYGLFMNFGKIDDIDKEHENEIRKEASFWKMVLQSDEAHFWLNGYVNKQNCRIWSEANPKVYVETPLHPEKLTVWCALWAGGIPLQKR
ncbi:uncharacterized protein TNCV_4579301 [Trichonephila clavipes]|nr:uncharacterized protein TNCV_4579301 [Trichonephila clavipes]